MQRGQLLNRRNVDWAVIYAVSTRCWQFPAGLLTTIFVARFFSREVQGYYYTFSTLLGLQSLVDMGLQWVILHFASHEWASLSLSTDGRITGPDTARDRLGAMARLAWRWFLGTVVVFVIAVASIGAWLFAREPTTVAWRAPWLAAVLLAGLSLLLSPLLAILEGCNQVLPLNRTRLWQAITASFCVWAAMAAGAELWVVVVAFGIQVLWEGWLALYVYAPFWKSLEPPSAPATLDWRREIWPLQWRIGIQSVVRYFAFQIFTPVIFAFHGAELAGRMGMSWSILSNIQLAAFAPVRTRAPRFGMLIARREYPELDAQFMRTLAISVCGFLAALFGFSTIVALLAIRSTGFFAELGSRFLSPLAIVVLGLGSFAIHIAQCLAVYIRAHKRDPLLPVLVTSNVLIGTAVLALGAAYGPLAAGIGFALAACTVTLPGVAWVWWTTRREWHMSAVDKAHV